MSHVPEYLRESAEIIDRLDVAAIERMAALVADVRDREGRLFLLGVGGSAANCSHAVNDFRKIAGLEAYAPTDNVSELTARTNDEGWPSVFVEWLKGSRLRPADLVFVLSVGGGNLERNVSPNLVNALRYAQDVGARIAGIVGRDDGYTARVAEVCVVVPAVNDARVTPHTEEFQAVLWHLLVSHPLLQIRPTRWESLGSPRRAVFLDRDGVLVRAVVHHGKPSPPATLEEMEIIPGVPAALGRLHDAGFQLIVVTNQPDVARGTQSRDVVEAMHAALRAQLPVDEIRTCYHDDDARCGCRKPEPGLLLDAAREAGIELSGSFMVGDRWRDIEAGRRAGCTTVFIDHGYDEVRPDHPGAQCRSLPEAAEWILSPGRVRSQPDARQGALP